MSDFITTRHPHFEKAEDQAEFVEKIVCGEVRTPQFVPKPFEQTHQSYEAYVNRAAFFNVTERTVQMLIGALLRKPFKASTELPINSTYATFSSFLQDAFYELMAGGRVGIYVDYAENAPYFTTFCSKDITNWIHAEDGSLMTVVLREGYMAQSPKNPYEQVCADQYRELTFDENGNYIVRIWRQKSKKDWIVVSETQPTLKGQPLKHIPFYFCNSIAADTDIVRPPLFSIAELNAQHFRTATDIAHAAHFVALPQPYIIGQFEGQDVGIHTSKAVGTFEVWQLTQGSEVGYMEFAGQGMKFLMDLEKGLEDKMMTMGSRLLTNRGGVESAEALSIRAGSETATLETITNALESCLNSALVDYSAWANQSEITIELNRDFTAAHMDPAQIKSLLDLYMASTITLDQLLTALYSGEVIKNSDPV